MKPYYDDGVVTLYLGDCRDVPEWIAADVMLTDPPYGYAFASNQTQGEGRWRRKAIAGDDDTSARDEVLARWGDRPALVFGSWKRPRPVATKALLTWDKGLASGMGDLSIPWKPNTEEIYVLGSGYVGHRGSSVLSGYTVVTWSTKGRKHPNEKPLGLLHDLLQKCPPGVVADPFAGSGSTLVAAKNLGRRAIGVEIDEAFCEVSAKRLSQDVLPFYPPEQTSIEGA